MFQKFKLKLAERLNRRLLSGLLLACIVLTCVEVLYQPDSLDFTPQTKRNLEFAANPSYADAFEKYPLLWGPLYPSALWLMTRCGIPLERIHYLFFIGILFWTWLYLIRKKDGCLAGYVVFLLVVSGFNYNNMYQYVSETFLTLLMLCSFSTLINYLKKRRLLGIVWLAVWSLLMCMTKYFGLFFLFPIIIFNICFSGKCSLKRRLVHAAVYSVIVLLVSGGWFNFVYERTGYITGMDRTGARYIPYFTEPGETWINITEVTTLENNLRGITKTIFIDFLSVHRHGDHGVVDSSLITNYEYAVLGPFVLIFAAILIVGVRVYRSSFKHFSIHLLWQKLTDSDDLLIVQYYVSYIVFFIMACTRGNSDPVYTRFVYPTYIFMILLFVLIYSRVRARQDAFWVRLPFQCLYVMLILIQSIKCFRFL